MIVICDWDVSFLERIKVLLELNYQNLPIEPFGYTEEEFSRIIEEENPFILNVLKKGAALYDAKLV